MMAYEGDFLRGQHDCYPGPGCRCIECGQHMPEFGRPWAVYRGPNREVSVSVLVDCHPDTERIILFGLDLPRVGTDGRGWGRFTTTLAPAGGEANENKS